MFCAYYRTVFVVFQIFSMCLCECMFLYPRSVEQFQIVTGIKTMETTVMSVVHAKYNMTASYAGRY
jgi:hypothetical protein